MSRAGVWEGAWEESTHQGRPQAGVRRAGLGGTPRPGCRMPRVRSGACPGAPSTACQPTHRLHAEPSRLPGALALHSAALRRGRLYLLQVVGCHPGKPGVRAAGLSVCRKSLGQRERADGRTVSVCVCPSVDSKPPTHTCASTGISSLERKGRGPLKGAVGSRVNLWVLEAEALSGARPPPRGGQGQL